MWSFNAMCDQFSVSSRLYFKLDLMPSRESVLHYFEQIRKHFPDLSRLERRDDGTIVLENRNGPATATRLIRLSNDALKVNQIGPENATEVQKFVRAAFGLAPSNLSLSDLDLDQLEVVFAFDLEYAGNQDAIVASTLLGNHPLVSSLSSGETIVECQPAIGFSVGGDCTTQVFFDIKNRTQAVEVRTGDYQNSALTVHVTVRRYWDGSSIDDLPNAHRELLRIAEDVATNRVLPNIVQPLAAAISNRQ